MATTGYYYNFNFSLPFVELILKLLGRQQAENPSDYTNTANREWFSTPRLGTDTTTECVTVTFQLPLSVSEISTEILRMPCRAEVWYQDRSNNWLPVLDRQRIPLKVTVDRADTKSWYKWTTRCYPIVAKKVQLRLTRLYDSATEGVPYPVGLRNTLLRRNVYERSQAGQFEDEVDVMGNVVSKYVKDWDARLAADDNYLTFWKSAPQPDPLAVVSLYLDVRAPDGTAQVIDKIYLDPVYTGQHLNLYFSNDETVGTRFLSPVTLPPAQLASADSGVVTAKTTTTVTDSKKSWLVNQWAGYHLLLGDDGDPLPILSNTATALTVTGTTPTVGSSYRIGRLGVLNVEHRTGVGLIDRGDDTRESFYRWPLGVGVQVKQNAWIGVQWRPNFDSANANLAQNPTLFAVLPDATGSAACAPSLYYVPNTRRFVLQMTGPNGPTYTSTAITQDWNAGDTLKIVAGWRYGPDTVHITVRDSKERDIVSFTQAVSTLPERVSFGGTAGVGDFRGTLTNMVAKLENYTLSSSAFLANPALYCDPEPVIPTSSGKVPSTTLDNAIYVAPFVAREHGSGGSDQSHFDEKEWTPIWRDYTAVKGMLHLPRAVRAQYLKLEFTNLTEQPYPIFESGIDVKYKVFPIQVTQQSSIGPKLYTGQGGFLGMGTFISVNGVRSVNWLNPVSVLQAVGSVLGPQTPPVLVNTGTPYIVDSLPHQGSSTVESSRRVEAASSYVYARDAIQPYVLAKDQYNTLIKAEGLQAIQPYVGIPWTEIEAANPGAVTKVKSTGTVPIRGTDWWIYPGQQLKIPASVMTKITDTQTVTERKLTLENRRRFNTTQVHRYDTRTVRRDAAVAYFAGVREVQPYTSTYITGEDKPVFDFPLYDASGGWTFSNITKAPSGAITPSQPNTWGIVSNRLTTQSEFAKLSVEFRDSGLVRSNSMWADIDADVQTIDDTQLSPYVGILPGDIPTGTWKDILASWDDQETVWGFPYGVVSISVDNERRYLGKRVVHFTREGALSEDQTGESGEAGITLKQFTNIVPGAMIRLGCAVYRPRKTSNQVFLTLRRTSDGVIVHREAVSLGKNANGDDKFPTAQWFQYTTPFVEIPETLPYAGFDDGLVGWTPTGGDWTDDNTVGRTGTGSAKLVTDDIDSTLTSGLMDCDMNTTVACSAWLKWSGLATGQASPPIYLKVLMCDDNGDVVQEEVLQNAITPTVATSTTTWTPVSGTAAVPQDLGITQVRFQLVVEEAAGAGGTVWVDDFSTDVPGTPRQRYEVWLTLKGDQQEDIYVSDLYTEVTPIRYFIRLGPPTDPTEPLTEISDDPNMIEVTDLRYTKNIATVTCTEPVNDFLVQAVITSQRASALGCTITPAYLK